MTRLLVLLLLAASTRPGRAQMLKPMCRVALYNIQVYKYTYIIIRIIHYTRGPDEVYILYNLSAALPPAQGAYCVSTQPQAGSGVGRQVCERGVWGAGSARWCVVVVVVCGGGRGGVGSGAGRGVYK